MSFKEMGTLCSGLNYSIRLSEDKTLGKNTVLERILLNIRNISTACHTRYLTWGQTLVFEIIVPTTIKTYSSAVIELSGPASMLSG